MPFQVAGKVHLEIEDADGTQMVVFLQGSAATKVCAHYIMQKC